MYLCSYWNSLKVFSLTGVFIRMLKNKQRSWYKPRTASGCFSALFQFLPRDALQCKTRSCDRMSSVRPSVCLSVTLVDFDDIGWNFFKLISPLVSLGCSLSAEPNVTGLLQGEHPEILAVIGVGYERMRISTCKSCNISETRQGRTKVTFVTIEDQYEIL